MMKRGARLAVTAMVALCPASQSLSREVTGIVRLTRNQRALETTRAIPDVDVDRAELHNDEVPPFGTLTKRPTPSLARRPLRRLGTIDRTRLALEIWERFRDLETCRARAARAAGIPLEELNAGEISLRWTILPSGGTRGAVVVERSDTELPLMKCVRRRMNSWQFTAPAGGSVNVAYDYRFSRGSAATEDLTLPSLGGSMPAEAGGRSRDGRGQKNGGAGASFHRTGPCLRG